MDSVLEALKYLLLYLPVKYLSTLVEALGVCYGMVEYPFKIGKHRASRVYDNWKGK